MAQSGAMLRYAGTLATARGVPLYPAEEMLAIEEALGLAGDLQREWRPPVGIALDCTAYGYPAEFKGTPEHAAVVRSMREQFVAGPLPRYMGFLERRLAASGGFLVGAAPTIADCELVPVLNRLASGGVDHVPASCLEPFPLVMAYVGRFMKLPAIKAWYAK
jgi:glutathione S-transferase